MLMPAVTAAVSSDYDRDWKLQPEHIYVHILLLIAAALDPLFGAELVALVTGMDGIDLHAGSYE